MTAAVARRQRAVLLRDIARELKAKDRRKLADLRARVRALRAERKQAIRAALTTCAARRSMPTQREALALLRADKAAAKSACDAARSQAKALREPVARARAERDAEHTYQADLRRIERLQRDRERAQKKSRGPVRARRDETDEQVRGNIPPELVALFNRVRGQIHGSERMSRTEAFLHYAEEHPDEQWEALEDKIDAAIAEMERRQAMANPKKKTRSKSKKKKSRNPSPAFAHVKKQLARSRAEASRLRAKLKEKKHRRNPKGPPRRWFDHCLASVDAQRYARDPAAVCGAAWWKKPARERAAIVRRLERGSAKQRRFAVGIAKAERRRADRGRRPPPRKNPATMTDAEARREYERTHWGEKGRDRISQKRAPDPAFGTATKLGKLVAVTYRTKKGGDRELVDYEHEFEGRLPELVYNEGGLIIAGGDYKIRQGGIDG